MHDDLDLLRQFAREGEEAAFAEVVRRHVNLVYSAALRQVRSPQLAEEVAQSVFTDLASRADRLKPGTVVAAWLYQVTRHKAIDVVRQEARRQLREQVAVEMNAMNSTSSDWAQVEPLLDEAMAALDDTDRAAVLLRYFENKSLRDVGAALGTSDDTAQKRVSRAVDRLREFFAQRGVTVGAGALTVAVSTHAVHAAPAGLAAAVSTALAATTLTTTATVTTTQAVAMTTLQKTLVTAVLAAAGATGIYEAQQAAGLRAKVHVLEQRQAPLTEQIQQVQRQRDQAAGQFAAAQREIEQLKQDAADIHRLRGEITLLRRAQETAAKPANAGPPPGPAMPKPAAARAVQAAADIGRELGAAVVRGEPGALEKVAELSKAALKSFQTNAAGMNDTQRGELAARTFASAQAAFDVIGEAAANGNPVAIAAVERALQIQELKGQAVKVVGTLAGKGNEPALEMLTNPDKYGILLSSSVFALRSAVVAGNPKAINSLAAVAKDERRQALWMEIANSLAPAAESGSAAAVDGLVSMSVATNRFVRDAVVSGLKRAAAKQDAKAVETLRAMGLQ